VIYAPAVLAVLKVVDVHAIAHITGGGLPGNVSRVLPDRVDAVVDRSTWETPRIFAEVQRLGAVDDEEMTKVFNLGIGMVLVVNPRDAYRTLDVLRSHGHGAREIGVIEPGRGGVRLVGSAAE
jgi:phosphoribosylformylglycinamidine cyclo-ligase